MTYDFLIIMNRELEELLRNRYILSTMAAFPLIFSISIPLIYMLTIPDGLATGDVAMFASTVPGHETMTPEQIIVYFLVQSNLPFYLLMPGLMPTLISSYSMVGEKKSGTLEPLLATPVTSEGIMFGKTLAAVIPSVLITWLSFFIYALLIDTMTLQSFGYLILPNLNWLITIIVAAPLLAVLSVYATVIVSARMTDIRAAQQVSAVIIVPIMAIFIAQLFGMISLDAPKITMISAALLVIDVVLIKTGAKIFRRGEILSRWN